MSEDTPYAVKYTPPENNRGIPQEERYGTVCYGKDRTFHGLEYYQVTDVIYPATFYILKTNVEAIEDCWDLFDDYIKEKYEAAVRLCLQNDPEELCVNDIFNVGVADGSAYYIVTRRTSRTCHIEWRGFGGLDGYTCQVFEYGGKFLPENIKHLAIAFKRWQNMALTDGREIVR